MHTLWSWEPASEGGSLQRVSKQLALPSAPHSLSPAWATPPDAARPTLAPAPASITALGTAPQPQAMDVDGDDAAGSSLESEAPQAGVLVVFMDGSVALCTFAAGAMALSSTAAATDAAGPASTSGGRVIDVAFDREGAAALVQCSGGGAGAVKGSTLTYTATLHQRQARHPFLLTLHSISLSSPI